MSDWIADKVRGLTQVDLHRFNKAINARIAEGLTTDAPNPLTATNDLAGYLSDLGDGTNSLEGLRTGIDELDHLIGGINRFTLLAARAGTGKSTLAVQMALGVIATGVPVLYYSYEMPRRDVITMALQNLRRGHTTALTRSDIILRGRTTYEPQQAALQEAAAALSELGGSLYIVDAAMGEPSLDRMRGDIERVEQTHGAKPLVIIDSIQDLVKPGNAGATSAEAETAQQIVELQMETEATILAISQKAKGNNLDDPYSAVLGSVSLIHKPNCIFELIGVHDLIRGLKDADLIHTYRKLADASDIPRPVIARVIKGRFNGTGHVSLKHYGRYSYFEPGRIHDYDVNPDGSIYDLNAFTG